MSGDVIAALSMAEAAKKIANKEDLFGRGHKYEVVKLDEDFPEYTN